MKKLEEARLLFVGLCPPIPTTNGQRMRNRNLLRALKREGVKVSFLSFAEPDELRAPQKELFELCEKVELLPAPKRNSHFNEYLGRLANLFMLSPYAPRRFKSEMMAGALRKALSENHFQAIICDEIYLATNLPKDLSVPILLSKQDLTYEIMARYLETETNFAKKLYGFVEYKKVRRMELHECNSARAVLACSARDRGVIQSVCPGASVHVLPNVVDTDDYAPARDPGGECVLFVGSLDWLPNRDAIDYFISDIFPRLRQMHPGVRFVVAGRLPPPSFKARLTGIPDVELHADVPDIRTLIEQAAVCIVPLRIGSGTRMKILEAAAMAKPIVSTRLGAEGLDFVEHQEIVLEDEPLEFAKAVSMLMKDDSRRREMGQAARAKVERQYGIATLCSAWRDILLAGGK
jgi:glycosyltransferase involved in cell wall biosynthesis